VKATASERTDDEGGGMSLMDCLAESIAQSCSHVRLRLRAELENGTCEFSLQNGIAAQVEGLKVEGRMRGQDYDINLLLLAAAPKSCVNSA
jgi:hypothetical protein